MDTVPWYRQPWPWFVISLPAEADYYRRGLEINAELARYERAAQLGLKLELVADGLRANDRVVLRVNGEQPLPPDATVQLRLVVPGRPAAERRLLLARVPRSDSANEASFAGTWPDDPAGAGAHGVREWSAESPSWLVDGDADWRDNDGRAPLTAHATAR